MRLRKYEKEDAKIICKWINDPYSLKLFADDIYKFPLTEDQINEFYKYQNYERFLPLTYLDDNDNIIGHVILRYPSNENNIRLGFLIIDNNLRGKGYGKKLLLDTIKYAKENYKPNKISLGVFINNESAYNCYKKCGFIESSERKIINIDNEELEMVDMELKQE